MCSIYTQYVAICAFTFGLPATNQHKEDEPRYFSIHDLELLLLCRATHVITGVVVVFQVQKKTTQS